MTEPVSPVEGAEGWHYGPFGSEPEEGLIVVPLVRDDGETLVFKAPDFLTSPADIRRVALVVIGAREEWEAREGLGA
jgi:hypothetical protein